MNRWHPSVFSPKDVVWTWGYYLSEVPLVKEGVHRFYGAQRDDLPRRYEELVHALNGSLRTASVIRPGR